jgi:hypothetical protein
VWQLLKAVSEPRKKKKKKNDELDLWRIEDEW